MEIELGWVFVELIRLAEQYYIVYYVFVVLILI